MRRLLVSAWLAGLAISGPAVLASEIAAAEQKSAPTGTDTLAASDKPIFPIYPRSSAGKAATIKTAAVKTSGKPARIPLPVSRPPEAEEADASATDAAGQPAETQANAAPAETQTAEPPASDTPADAADQKAAETKPGYMKTGHPQIDALVATHAKANNIPEALIHRVIVRESKYQKDLVGSCGCIGLMQIKLGTARGLGYSGDAQGLHDANTNLTYGVKYLAGAYRAANGNHDRAVQYFAKGYYDVAKRQRLAEARPSDARALAKLERAHAPLDIMPKQIARASKHAASRTTEAQAAPQ
ncbi:MAG: lytic transglycosylase domain-containing protein [Tardiphaga sp.]